MLSPVLDHTIESCTSLHATRPLTPRPMMSTTVTAGSVTVMIRFLRAGDRTRVPALWELYFERLARLAHPIVRFGPIAARGTEEDAALSAIDAFCNGIAEGKFPYVDSREVLWATLAKITER